MSDEAGSVRVEHHPGRAEVILARPGKRNALSMAMLRELQAALAALAVDESVRVVLLTGEGDRAFSAGADLAEMAALDAAGIGEFLALGHGVADALEQLPQPVIAAVNGFALGGGCELMLACDLALAADSAVIGLPEIDLALIPGWGGTQRLARRVGLGRALHLILTGSRISAEEAARIGLIDRVVPAAELLAETRALAEVLAAKDPTALRAAKAAVRAALAPGLAEGLRQERERFATLFARPARVAATERFFRR